MKDNFNIEKIVKRKAEGSFLLFKIALIAAYVIIAAVGLFLTLAFADGEPLLILLVFGIDVCAVLLTWKFTLIEYEYSIIADTLYIATIYNKSTRREIFEAEISRATLIAPYKDEYEKTANASKPDDVLRAVSSLRDDDIWFAIFELEGAKKALVLFNADEDTVASLRHHNPRATVRYKFSKNGENDNA